ncbi:MAG: exodeoxyribonuclease VII small subunit [Methanocalculaceae archaeon]|jgi:exodeoxyribonuclease VII small subunit|nr:exodeoxyribonuclease VII small subunit [Methanocalculaceae archaeon]
MTEIAKVQTYELMISELKEIAKQLDDPETPLEEMMRLHQRGLALIRSCEEFLQKAELTITEIQLEE